MVVLFLAGRAAEAQGNPTLAGLVNLEGKEVRFGINASTLLAVVTTVTVSDTDAAATIVRFLLLRMAIDRGSSHVAPVRATATLLNLERIH